MEGVLLCLHLLFMQQAVFPVTAQTVTLETEGTFVENSATIFHCIFTAPWNAGTLRQWIGPGTSTLITNGLSIDAAKYTETIDNANNRFSMTIQNYNSGDEGSYQCQYGFAPSNGITLSISNTEVHPSSPPLDSVAIPDTTEAIDLTISVPGIRPNASASFNLTSSTGTLKPDGTGSAVVTVTADGNGRTSSSSLKIDVPAGTTSTGDIFTITLVVGAYSETKQWTIAASSSSSNCDLCTPTNVLAALGIVFAVVCVALCWKVYFKFSGKPITYIYVQINTTVTLTCPADDKATKLTWTGPGGIPYVTGTTVEAGLSGSVKQRISARHTGGSYTLTIKAFQSSDMGIYTSKVNGTVDSQMVILEESGGGKGKFECSVTWCFRATIIATVVSVIGFILCIAGLIICVTCDDSVSSSNSVTVAIALAAVGFVLAAVTLVIVIILVILFCRGVITKKDDGQTIKHVSVKNNDPLTLTCPAGDLATTLTWTGPGGIPYVTGTTVEADLDGSVKRRISASHKKRGYALMFTEVWSSDMGIYTSTVDETVVKHEVIVQDNKAVRAQPDGQDAKPRTERTPRSAGSPTSASNIKTKWRNNQVSDSNESDGSNDTPRRKLEAVPPGRKLPALGLVDASQKANPLEPIEVNETKKLKKKKKRRSKEERAQVDGEY